MVLPKRFIISISVQAVLLVLAAAAGAQEPAEAELRLAIAEAGGEPAESGDTLLEKEVPPGEPSIFELDVILTTENLEVLAERFEVPETETGRGPEDWLLSIAHEPCPGVSMLFWDTPDPERKIPGNVTDDCTYAGNMTRGFEIGTLVDQDVDRDTPPVEEAIDPVAGVGFNFTRCATGDYEDAPAELAGLRGLVSSMILTELGSAHLRSLIANHRDVLMKLLVRMPPVAPDEESECRIFFASGLRSESVTSGTGVNNAFEYWTATVYPTSTRGLILRVRGAPPAEFIRGDADGDGDLALTDVILALTFQFVGGVTLGCEDAADVDDDGQISISDSIRSLNYQFSGSAPAPGPPGLQCGLDPTADELYCRNFEACP